MIYVADIKWYKAVAISVLVLMISIDINGRTVSKRQAIKLLLKMMKGKREWKERNCSFGNQQGSQGRDPVRSIQVMNSTEYDTVLKTQKRVKTKQPDICIKHLAKF